MNLNCLVCGKDIVETTSGGAYVHVDGRQGHLPVAEITDWQTDDTVVKGSTLNADVYYACYSLAMGAADAVAVLNPRLEIYVSVFEYAFRRFAVQHKLCTQHEVFMHSADVIGYVVTQAARDKNVPAFVPPF